MKLNEFLTQVRQRLEKATPGPWEVDSVNEVTSSEGDICWQMSMLNDKYENAQLIAHAPSDLAKLLKLVEIQATALQQQTAFSCTCDYWHEKCPQCIAGEALEAAEKVVGE